MSNTYDNIERPFGEHLEREAETLLPNADEAGALGVSGGSGAGTTSPSSSTEDKAKITDADQIEDLYIKNWIKSLNWKPKKQGFYLDGETGYAEFSNVYITGGITLDTSSAIKGGQDDYDSGVGFFLGYSGGAYKFSIGNSAGGPKMLWDGNELDIIGGSIQVPGDNTALSMLDYTHDIVFSGVGTDQVDWTSGTLTMSNGVVYNISAGSTGTVGARTFIYFDKVASETVLQTTTTVSNTAGVDKILLGWAQNGTNNATFQVYGGRGGVGVDIDANVDISAGEWIFPTTWSLDDADTVSWGAATLTASDGSSYSISAGNTGNMVAKTYIYLDTLTSLTVLQTTTTAANAVGEGKLLIAIAQNGTTEPSLVVVNDDQFNIDASRIVAGSIVTNNLAAGAVTAAKIDVTQLSAISADMGTITAGTITLATTGFIRGGQTAYNTGTGFFLGYDSTHYKFSMGIGGQDDNNIRWDGTKLIINGYDQTGIGTYGGDGSDGALTVTGGTTTLNTGQLYQFTSVSIESTGILTFTGDGVAQMLIQGNFTIAAGGKIDLRYIATKYNGGVVGIHALEGGGATQIATNSLGGLAQTTIDGFNGGAGGDGNGAGAGTGGAAGVNGSSAGTDGADGTTNTVGGGGGGGGGSDPGTYYVAPTAGAAASGLNGGNGGVGGTGNTGGGAGGSGGGGTGTGNGGNGGRGGDSRPTVAGTGYDAGDGGHGGDSGPTGGVGGDGGAGGDCTTVNLADPDGDGGDGGNGGAGYTEGGRGGNGGDGFGHSSTFGGRGGNGGNGGNSLRGYGGDGGTGGLGDGVASNQVNGGRGGTGGNGALGGGNGGDGGDCTGGTSSSNAGNGGDGGDAFSGLIALFIFAGGNMTLAGTINANGGSGGNGGNGGDGSPCDGYPGDGGDGGDGAPGSDVYLLCKGTYTDNGIIINARGGKGGAAGAPGAPGANRPAGLNGLSGRDGRDGRVITGTLTI